MGASQCYGRVFYYIASLLALSYGLPLPSISMLLSTLQVMSVFLSMGFGELDVSYGGTRDNPFQVILQVNGVGP